ncbi:ABC transporter ATP-binding protein [Ketogulonicigenium vulgare]|uniref:ABC transporter ATP-binding protein n=1 Tax=Ketogulonicigenium vulgare TaxID=92945 RepID=UPI002359176E|nr:ABC transporter ATP-binding protein [Ketogulonicigenium vulgare]
MTTRIAPGQIVGLIGANGTGKSTLLNAIAGLQRHTGNVLWLGEKIRLDHIGYMPQQARVDANLSVTETLLLGQFGRLGWRVSSAAMDRVQAALQSFDIAHLHDRAMATLSGGQQQRVLLAQRLLSEPNLLLLDEATSALDIRHQMQALQILRAYVVHTGALVVIALHDLNMAGHHCDNIWLLHGGKILAEGSFDQVITPGNLGTAYGIEAEFVKSGSGRQLVLPTRSVSFP